MKRVLILLSLMAVLLVPQLAQAAPFFLGTNAEKNMAFDDLTSVGDNLEYLKLLDPNASFTRQEISYFDLYKTWQFTGVGFSDYAANNTLSMYTEDERYTADSSVRFENEYTAEDVWLGFFRQDLKQADVVDLLTILNDPNYVEEVYVLDKDISFMLDQDSELFSFKAGTIFFGFKIPGNDSITQLDVILAANPSGPAVPVPAAVWLMGTGVAGLVALRRKTR